MTINPFYSVRTVRSDPDNHATENIRISDGKDVTFLNVRNIQTMQWNWVILSIDERPEGRVSFLDGRAQLSSLTPLSLQLQRQAQLDASADSPKMPQRFTN